MSDRKRKLAELAAKRKVQLEDQEKPQPKKAEVKKTKPVEKVPAKREPESPPRRRGSGRLDEYEDDGFIVGDDEVEEEEGEQEDEDVSEEEEEEEEERRPKKKDVKAKGKQPEKKKKKKNESEDEPSESEDDIDNELEGLDTSNIITGSRRTRGKKIDFSRFGPDPDDEDE
ncbi:uncharacterized protein VTP21DRAFT_7320 [Calcarisporiella thermophila]|uniref:uncharacterized protein n=1 Tax=Calcarisporiella thermophila TaxID=911321 RepID=UPI003742463E